MFQHAAARRRLVRSGRLQSGMLMFQHAAARRRLGYIQALFDIINGVSTRQTKRLRFNTQPPEGGWHFNELLIFQSPKFQHAAARRRLVRAHRLIAIAAGFNTQPPEGGWVLDLVAVSKVSEFQHAAARRRLGCVPVSARTGYCVSTRSRPKAAGLCASFGADGILCFNTQPPEGGWMVLRAGTTLNAVSTRSRPKAAGSPM